MKPILFNANSVGFFVLFMIVKGVKPHGNLLNLCTFVLNY